MGNPFDFINQNRTESIQPRPEDEGRVVPLEFGNGLIMGNEQSTQVQSQDVKPPKHA